MPKLKKSMSSQRANGNASKTIAKPQTRWDGRFSITITLVTAIGLLTLISVGVVLGVGVWLAQKNTFALLSANSHQGVTAAVDRIKQHLKPAEHQAKFIAERIAAGDVDPTNREMLGVLFSGALASAPQIDSVIFIDKELKALLVTYDPQLGKVRFAELDYTRDLAVQERLAKIKPGANWGTPIWRKVTKKTYLNMVYPVAAGDISQGAVVAAVSVEHLSAFVGVSKTHEVGQRFMLFGKNHVLAHSLMVNGYPGLSDKVPLPRLAQFKDRVLAAIWQKKGRYELRLDLPKGTDGHVLEMGSDRYIFVYQEMADFGPEPLIAGVYFRNTDVGEEVRRMFASLLAGIVALIVSLLAAIFIGRKIARPIVRFSQAAGSIRNLDISQVEDLPGSMLRELNDQSASFNTMLRALKWFELYVPKKIVEHLVKRGDVNDTLSSSRNITVMFTDIVSFSTTSQGMSAHDVAELLNHHFGLIGACIDAEDGTIDKYMGDSVMAFWGAPEKQKHRAERACRAALEIAAVIREDNEKRVSHGEKPIGIRIGIHTGNATVGNIGSPGRINYTIIGDSVNIGQRLEQLGRQIYPPGTDVSILISGDTAKELSDAFKPVSAGWFELKGRDGEVEVFRLL